MGTFEYYPSTYGEGGVLHVLKFTLTTEMEMELELC